ncbi:MAG: hypothetical protein LBE12_11295 [Planctomycetaceae bacterium]|nr:hypothetical protein [Planctomycetaceae bacterium]
MSQADYYQNGNHSACDTIHSPLLSRPMRGFDKGDEVLIRRLRYATPTVMPISSLRD